MIFPFKEKVFSCKSLCYCVIILLLCLLKFIHNHIEFFPTLFACILLFFFGAVAC